MMVVVAGLSVSPVVVCLALPSWDDRYGYCFAPYNMFVTDGGDHGHPILIFPGPDCACFIYIFQSVFNFNMFPAILPS